MAFDSLLSLIILVGAVQGFIVTAILTFQTARNKTANRYLAALIFLISLASLGVYWMQIGIKYTSETWLTISQVVPFFVVMPIGPLIYFYVRSFASENMDVGKNFVWHLAPIVVDVVPQILFLLSIAGLLSMSIVHLSGFVDQWDVYTDILRWGSVSVYLLLSMKYLKTLNKKRAEDRNRLSWLRQFIKIFLIFQTVWFAHLVPYIIPTLRNDLLDSVGWYPVYLPLAGLIYYFGIKGILVSNTFGAKAESPLIAKLSPERITLILGRLKNAMTLDKLYLEPALTVANVSTHIDIPSKQISLVLNQAESKSFNEFVNTYRVEDFKKKIHDPRLRFMTLSGLAFECGFNSQATFQRTFKALEGMSPTEYFNLHKPQQRISA